MGLLAKNGVGALRCGPCVVQHQLFFSRLWPGVLEFLQFMGHTSGTTENGVGGESRCHGPCPTYLSDNSPIVECALLYSLTMVDAICIN